MTKILDCTIRDGGSSDNWTYTEEEIIKLIQFLNKEKIEYFEIGYRNNLEKENKGSYFYCYPNLLKEFYDIKRNLKLGVMVDTKRFSENDFLNAKKDYLDFVRIATHPETIKKAISIAEMLRGRGYKVFLQLMEISNLSMENYLNLYNWENKSCLETLYFADTFGILTPDDITIYYQKLKSLGFENISFHSHNDNNNALKNTIKAVELGAYSIDISQNSKGRYGGNLCYSDLKKYWRKKSNLIKKFFILLIKIYQFFSKMTPSVCRFYPTCSEYTKQAIIKYGIFKGIWLGLKRISRCHPGNPGGYDPVP